MPDPIRPELGPLLRRELDDRQLDAQYSAIERSLAGRRLRRRVGLSATLVLALLLTALMVRKLAVDREPEQPWRGQLASTDDAPRRLVLPDGSSLTLAPATQARLCDAERSDVCVALDHGAVEFAVTRDPQRSFWVEAGEVRVRVIGTRFVVEREPGSAAGGRVAVIVHEGIVEVDLGDAGTRRLAAGERWERAEDDARAELARASPAPSEAEARPSPAEIVAPPLDEPEPAPRPARPPSASAKHHAEDGPSDAELLWAEAQAARREGASATEADAYAQLLRRHPRDRRTGLAAFELGRLRMDELGDLAGAVAALERAIELGGSSSPYHEDALARLARAHARRGATAKCRSARAEYLRAYPEGVHVATVESLCPP